MRIKQSTLSPLFLSCGLVFGCSGADLSEATATEQNSDAFSCANGTRDALLNGVAEQTTGVTTPSQIDNPTCDNGYIVDFDGTVNGVHYGYRAETPRTEHHDGIRVEFPTVPISFFASCPDRFGGTAYFYEQQSDGTFALFATFTQHSHTDFARGACVIDTYTRSSGVFKGSSSAPHVYRVAVTATDQFHPDVGVGPFYIHACDVNHPC